MTIARYDVILDQSERAHLYNHQSNYTERKQWPVISNNVSLNYRYFVTFHNHICTFGLLTEKQQEGQVKNTEKNDANTHVNFIANFNTYVFRDGQNKERQ